MTLCHAVLNQLGDRTVPLAGGRWDLDRIVSSADGTRDLAVRISGNPTGFPVFFLHGTPGSRIGPAPRSQVLYKLGVRLISFDRPGYGRSDRLKSRQVADVAEDVERIAQFLGIDGKFAVLGRSGGGPHALACAARLPERVSRVGALVSLAPWDGMGPHQWLHGMSDSNIREYTTAVNDPEVLATRLVQVAAKIAADPTSHVAALSPEMPADDLRVMADAGIRALLARNFAEALARGSADGWIDDVLAFCSPWGFDLSAIKAPVLLWHGGEDVFSPVSHTQWLGTNIDQAQVVIMPGSAHFGALEVVPDVLSWLLRTDPAD
jgi:pimeloyl-ACP methyl ester carboxylesterase